MKIITIGATTNLRDEMQRRLPNLLVVNATSVEGIGEIAKKSEPVGAIVVELATSVDRLSFEYIRLAFQHVPKIVILNIQDEETTDLTEIARSYEAASVIPEPVGVEQFDTIAHLIRSFVQPRVEMLYRRFRQQIEEVEKELDRLADETVPFIIPGRKEPQEKGWLTEKDIEVITQIHRQLLTIGVEHAKPQAV